MAKEKGTRETELFHMGLIFLAVLAAGGAVYALFLRDRLPELPCAFFGLTGIYCPGCGGTRAIKALLQGHFLRSLWYHPLIPYMATVGGGFMLTQGLHRMGIKKVRGWRYHDRCLYGAVAVVLCNFLVKNALLLIWGIRI